MNGTLTSKITEYQNEIVMVPQVDYFSHSRYTFAGAFGTTKYLYKESETKGNELANNLTEGFNSKLDNLQAISMPLASTENFNTKAKYEDIIVSTFLAEREENEAIIVHYYKELEDEDYVGKLDIFRLNPEVWEFFNKNKINTISYAQFIRHNSKADRILKRPGFYFGFLTLGFTWPFMLTRVANYKQLVLYSYSAKLGELVNTETTKAYWLTKNKGTRMFKKMRRQRNSYVERFLEKN